MNIAVSTFRFLCSFLSAINRGLPNIPTFIRVVLKREKLSEEAESYRQRYEHLLAQLEQQSGVTLRPASLIGDDDSGYFSANRPKGRDSDEIASKKARIA